jgi:hypothetical protein
VEFFKGEPMIDSMKASLCVCTALAAVACGSGNPANAGLQTGTVSMALQITNGTTTYRLKNATFDISGPKSVSVTPAADAVSFKVELPAGDYAITLRDGWSMLSSDGSTPFQPVNAALDGPATQSFSIFAQELTYVQYNFRAGPDVLAFGDGEVVVQIGVNQGSEGKCSVANANCGSSITCSGSSSTIENSCTFSNGPGLIAGVTCNGTTATIPSGFGSNPNGYSDTLRILSELQSKLLAYFEAHGHWPVATAPSTPSATCCAAGNVSQCPANPGAWHGIAAWDLIGFSIDTAHTFVYSYTGTSGDSADVVASGDLDCDTVEIEYHLHCSTLNGDPSCALSFPASCSQPYPD